MADDLGYSDIGCYGGEISTPNLDRIASKGLRFRQFYNNTRCSPTRASMLTGQFAHKVGLDINGQNLTRNGATIAELLKEAGYQTGLAGKWHLSVSKELPDKNKHQLWLNHQFDPAIPFAPLETYPANRGFEKHFGIIWGVVNYFDPFSLVEGLTPVKNVPENFYMTDAITNKAVQFINEFSKINKPFFLYVAQTAPHWPLHARTEDIAHYKSVYTKGWDTIRRARYEKMMKLGIIGKTNTAQLPLMDSQKEWQQLSENEKKIQSAKMAVHAAMVHRMDMGIGQILKVLEETNKIDNTIIIFLADNGASSEVPVAPGYDRTSATRDGKIVKYKDFNPDEIGSETSYATIGPNWASAANTPFRFWKIEPFEGGIHTPMIIYWEKNSKAANTFTNYQGHVIDIMPTCLDIAGVPYPKTYKKNILTPLDGKSLLPVLEGRKEKEKACFFLNMKEARR